LKRVALLITGLERGGAELQVVELAGALRNCGWDVAVFALRRGPLAEELAKRGVAAPPLHSLLGFRPHILHSHLFHANIAARIARLFLPLPVVISTVHSLAESSRRGAEVRYRDFVYRITGALSDANVFVSTAAANRHLEASAVTAARTHVIPNGVDTDRFRPDPERRARTRSDLAVGDDFVWLAAGRLMWKKNYPMMLRAMERQRRSILLIAGAGPDEAELRAMAPGTVRFLGARTDLPDLMNAADGLVLSSTVEGLPMVLLEAAASGLPCVATAVGGVAEAVLADRTGYLVSPGDTDALSHAMRLLSVLPPADREVMSHEAREYALARFDLHAIVEQWEHLYRTLLAKEP
jgi:glycosyltransferase involved in cell wall biosynthesis